MAEDPLRDELLRQLKALLDGGQAHVGLERAAAELPFAKQGMVAEKLPYSPWQLLEHIRIAQRDILDFSRNDDGTYRHKEWPKEYWPTSPAPPDEGAWEQTLQAIRSDRDAFEALLQKRDLVAPFAWGDGQNLLREALLIADHNAYHAGELVAVRRLLGCWEAQP